MPGIDLNYFMRQANKLTKDLEERKTKLAEESVEGSSGDGMVQVTANGVQEIKRIKIAPQLLEANDVGMLEDIVTAAVNAALTASKNHMQNELGKISGGMKIPGLM